VAFVASRFHFSGPTNYLVRTGFGIPTVQVRKSFVRWPFQKIVSVHTIPINHKWTFKCLSKQYLPFTLPVTCTTGPYSLTDTEGAKMYAETMSTLSEEDRAAIIQAIVHGEFRVRASTVDIDDLNDNREKFRDEVVKKVEEALRTVGVRILNANIAEIEEEKRPGGVIGYLEAREKKKLMQAISESEINVADAKKQQDIETTLRKSETRQRVATLEREAMLAENEQKQKIAESNARLAVIQAESKKKEMVAKVEADKAALLREQELQKFVESANQERELVRTRAEKLTQTQVQAEQIRINADAHLYKVNQEAEAKFQLVKKEAEGKALEYKTQADGTLQLALSEAQGIFEKLASEGKGMGQIAQFSDDVDLVKLHLLLKTGTPVELARAHAEALKNLNPKIWNFTTTAPGSSSSSASTLKEFMNVFPAGLQMLQEYNVLPKSQSKSDDSPVSKS